MTSSVDEQVELAAQVFIYGYPLVRYLPRREVVDGSYVLPAIRRRD